MGEEPSSLDASIARLNDRIERLQQHLPAGERDKPSAPHAAAPATNARTETGFSWTRGFLTVCQLLSVLGCIIAVLWLVLGLVLCLAHGLVQGPWMILLAAPAGFCYSAGMFVVFSHVKEAKRA